MRNNWRPRLRVGTISPVSFYLPEQVMGPAQIQGVGKQAIPLSGRNCKITSQRGVDMGLGVKNWGGVFFAINQSQMHLSYYSGERIDEGGLQSTFKFSESKFITLLLLSVEWWSGRYKDI